MNFRESPSETVWKILGGCGADVRSSPWRATNTPRTCPNQNGVTSSLIFLCPQTGRGGRPKIHGSPAILDAGFFYVLKSGCPWKATAELLPKDFPPWNLGKASRTGSGSGASMAPSSDSTPPCASCCGVAWVGMRSLARPSPTPKRPRQPASRAAAAANTEDTTATRRFEVRSATCSGGHRGFAPESQGAQRKGPRPGRVKAALLQSARCGLSMA